MTEDVRLDLVETRTFGSRVIYERYRYSPRDRLRFYRLVLACADGSAGAGSRG